MRQMEWDLWKNSHLGVSVEISSQQYVLYVIAGISKMQSPG